MSSFAKIIEDAEASRIAREQRETRKHPNGVFALDQCEVTQDINGLFEVIKRTEEVIEYGILVLSFADGRTEAEQEAVFAGLEDKPFAPMVHQVMSIALQRIIGAKIDESRPLKYYMLCDEEEIETFDSGAMDGDLRTRAACPSWRVVVIYTSSEMVVEFVGHPHDLSCDPQGWAFHNDGSQDWIQLYDIQHAEVDTVAPETLAAQVKKIIGFVPM